MGEVKKHYGFGGSRRERLRLCPGSYNLSKGIPDQPDVFARAQITAHDAVWAISKGETPVTSINAAEAGTLGHAIIEMDLSPGGRGLIEKLRVRRHHHLPGDFLDGCQLIVDYVRELAATDPHSRVLLETHLHMKMIHEDCGGSTDIIVLLPSARTAHVIDAKMGRGKLVEARGNPQLRMYTVGAHFLGIIPAGFTAFVNTIAQPLIEHEEGYFRCEIMTLADIHEERVLIEGEVKRCTSKDAPLVPGAEQCRWCPAVAKCPAQRERGNAVAKAEFSKVPVEKAADFFGTSLGELLLKCDAVEAWIHKLREFAYQEATAGRCPDLHKEVDKRGTRQLKDGVGREEILAAIQPMNANSIYEDPKIKSVAQMEKFFGLDKKTADPVVVAAFAALYEVRSSGTKLVPLTDPGEPVNRGNPLTEFKPRAVVGPPAIPSMEDLLK